MVLVHFFPVVGDDVTCDVSKGSSRISVGGGKGGGGVLCSHKYGDHRLGDYTEHII